MPDTIIRSSLQSILLVTGMSGAGKSTVLKVLEDMGWETVDNLPLILLNRLLATPPGDEHGAASRPLAIGIDSRTRGFDADAIVKQIKRLRENDAKNMGRPIATIFVDCSGAELVRRYSETRRRHPLAQDRPAEDGIARERELTEPLRRWAEHVVDTTSFSSNDLQTEIRARFASGLKLGAMTITIMSFGFARGLPRNADLVFDMRFLQNPHWVPHLRPKTGLDTEVADYIAADPAYEEATCRILDLLHILLPRYVAEGKSYLTIAFGCTGGRHRSVHVAQKAAQSLVALGYNPLVSHRNLASSPQDNLEGAPAPDASTISSKGAGPKA
jgi:RNase adapter protein RapZ